jgi:hypothetical protein
VNFAAGALAGLTIDSVAASYYLQKQLRPQLSSLETSSSHKLTKKEKEYPEELKEEMVSRVRTFFGAIGTQKLADSFEVVSDYPFINYVEVSSCCCTYGRCWHF